MRILITMLTLLFVCGCSSEKASNQKGPLTIAKSDNVEKTIKTDNRLAGIDLNDVYQGFISYVKDVQEKYRNGELKQLEASPPANGDIFAERFSWIKPDDLKWYFTLRPVELLWASTVIMVVAQEIDMNDKSQD